MKSVIQNIGLLAAMLLTVLTASAYDYDFKVDGLCYNLLSEEDRTVEVTCQYYRSSVNSRYVSGDLVIPKRIIHSGKTYKVTAIGEEAFRFCNRLTSVTIPNSVTTIGGTAFWECSSLTSVEIPNSVTTIGGEAFRECSSLTSVEIPNSVTKIPFCAFYGCSGLTSVTIPNSVTTIGEDAFYGCSGLTSVTIPNSVTTIGEDAFRGCSGLTSVTIPNSVTTIGEHAFGSCSNLTDINVSEENTSYCSIDGILYSKDASLLIKCGGGKKGTVTIPNSVATIGEYAFKGCGGLTSVEIPNSATAIGEYAFSSCSGLTSVEIPNSVTTIGKYAFSGCSGLTSVTIGNSVSSIGEYAFEDCDGLTSVEIPNSVSTIGEHAFSSCSGLTSVTIGNSVTEIGRYAFLSLPLSEIYCKPETPPSDRGNNFSDQVLMNAKLYVPVGCKGAYEKVDPWRNFWNIEEMDFTSSIGEVVAGGDVEVCVSDGVITLSGNEEGATVEIFDMQGRKVFGGVGNVSASLPAGVYIVRTAGKTLKARI